MGFMDGLLHLGCQRESIRGGLLWCWPLFHSHTGGARFEISLKSAQTTAPLYITSHISIYLSKGPELSFNMFYF